jgi:hypothetical protein
LPAGHAYLSPSGSLQELATNAAKHGFLAHPTGKVLLSWNLSSRNNQPALRVLRREKNGPPAEPPVSTGFGSMLVEHGIPRATVRREFGPDGFLCTSRYSYQRPRTMEQTAKRDKTLPLTGARVLVVEDDCLISMDLESVLVEAGAEIAGVCRTVRDALVLANQNGIAAAILDY